MGLDYAASAPVLTIPPRQHHYPFGNPHFIPLEQQLPPTSNNITDGGQLNGSPLSQAPFSGSPTSAILTRPPLATSSSSKIAGRKRSRADIFETAEEDELIDDGSYLSQPAEPPKPRGEPIYGPGMTLIYPDDPIGFHIAADSQTGTWAEERQAAIEASRGDNGRPAIVSRKSMRRFMGVGARAQSQSSLPEFTGERDGSPIRASAMHDSPIEDDDHIDAAKLYLGVGWKSVAESPNLAIAARGWARFIENHFHLSNASVLLHNDGKQLYLVQASRNMSEQAVFWLFAEDLRSGQMLAHTLDGVVRNLTQNPIQFDGEPLQFQDRATPSSQPSPRDHQWMQDSIVAAQIHSAPITAEMHNQDVEMML